MNVNIGISEKNRQAVALALNQLLADEHILYNKTRNYHWSIEGPSFMEFHKLYEAQYTVLAETIDQIAERIRTIGHFAEGRLKEIIKLATWTNQQLLPTRPNRLKTLKQIMKP
jgi:starvation-inducible DNA-binding protein